MSIGSGDDRLSRNARRDAAREKAKALRDQQRRKERRNRWLLQGGIGAVVLIAIAIVAIVLRGSVTPAASGPLNMLSDGITIGKDFKAVPTAAIPANGKPVPTVRDKKSSVVTIRIYLDYFCPVCNEFETANKDQIGSWLKSGAATLEIHPISFLDHSSLGTRYASRAANAGACVANYSPNDMWTFTQAMYANQPKELTAGLTNAQINAVIANAGVANTGEIAKCVNKETFKSWVTAATDRATHGPLPDSNVATVKGTPTIIVDGLNYLPTSYSSASEFQAFVVQAAGASFNAGTTSTPTPTPTPVPTPSASRHRKK
jgi:protein-disulfide isomerase